MNLTTVTGFPLLAICLRHKLGIEDIASTGGSLYALHRTHKTEKQDEA